MANSLKVNRADFSKILTPTHIASAVCVIIGILAAIVFAKAQIYIGALASLLVAGRVAYMINRPVKAKKTKEDSVAQKRVTLNIDWGKVWKTFLFVVKLIVSLRWIPVRFHLEGTRKHFFLGWLPFCPTAGVLIPEVGIPFTKKWFRLTMIKIELVDILLDFYLVWSYLEIRAVSAAHPEGLSLMFDALAIGQVLLVMSILVVLNKDGSKWRVIFYITIAFAGLTYDLGNARLFALNEGWLNPKFIVVYGVRGQVIEFMCLFGLFFETAVQPVWNWLMGIAIEPVKRVTQTMKMVIVTQE